MKLKTRSKVSLWSLILLGVFFCFNVLPVSTYAIEVESSDIITASASDVIVSKDTTGNICISGKVETYNFAVIGQLYSVSDNINSNKIYFVESLRDYNSPVVVLNIEFEVHAEEHNVSLKKRSLIGKNVLRIAVYINNTCYYVEQEYNIGSIITDNVTVISNTNKSDILSSIISNATWYTHLNQGKISYKSALEYSVGARSAELPLYGDSLLQEDIDNISKIGRGNFTREQFIYGSTQTGGYMLHSVEWPASSGNILTSCLYYEIVKTKPSEYKNSATLDVELVLDRQYMYVASSNTLEAHFHGTDYRMYDAKLALGCAEDGYDYIWEQTITSYKVDSNTSPVLLGLANVAKTIAIQRDKSGRLDRLDAFFSAFEEEPELTTTSLCSWPDDYDLHYESTAHGKERFSMVRAIRIDTEGHILEKETEYLYLKGEVVDRDYVNSTANSALTKTIKYAFSYNLRSRNPYLLWLFNGDDHGEITYETYETYVK